MEPQVNDAFRVLYRVIEAQTEAIVLLQEKVKKLEERVELPIFKID